METTNSLHSNTVWQVRGDESSKGKTTKPTALITLGKIPENHKTPLKKLLLFRNQEFELQLVRKQFWSVRQTPRNYYCSKNSVFGHKFSLPKRTGNKQLWPLHKHLPVPNFCSRENKINSSLQKSLAGFPQQLPQCFYLFEIDEPLATKGSSVTQEWMNLTNTKT